MTTLRMARVLYHINGCRNRNRGQVCLKRMVRACRFYTPLACLVYCNSVSTILHTKLSISIGADVQSYVNLNRNLVIPTRAPRTATKTRQTVNVYR